LVKEAEKRLCALGCRKINLQVRPSNAAVVGFYRKLGYDEGCVQTAGGFIRHSPRSADRGLSLSRTRRAKFVILHKRSI
jgi:Acetyltransferase (GNAT) family